MSTTQTRPSTEFNKGVFIRNRFCYGKKRVCNDFVNNPEVINRVIKLMITTLNRILRWEVWDLWWLDVWKSELLNIRNNVITKLGDKYGNDIINDILKLIDELVEYLEKFSEYWSEERIGDEIKRLFDELIHGKVEVVVHKGGTGFSIYGEHITLVANETNSGVTAHLELKGLEGVTIDVPDIFNKAMSKEEYEKFIKELLKALRGGFAGTDEKIEDGKAAMGTTQIWQAIIWSLLYFGKVYIHVDAININEGGVTMLWHLKSYDNDSLKHTILKEVEKFNKEALLAFMLTSILGDGSAYIAKNVTKGHVYNKAVIQFTMSSSKFRARKPIFKKLWDMGFRWSKKLDLRNNTVNVLFYSSRAIDLSRAMINTLPPILRDLLDVLGPEKWVKLRSIANMEVKFRIGESQIIIANYGFTVFINESTVELRRKARNEVEINEVYNTLKSIYGDEFVKQIRINKSGKYLIIIIPIYLIKMYDDIKRIVIENLCQRLGKTRDERRKRIIGKHLMRLIASNQ